MKRTISYLFFLFFITFYVSGQPDENLIHVFKNHQDAVNSVAFSKDGRYLVSVSEDKSVNVYNLNTFDVAYSIKDNYFPLKGVYMTRSGDLLLGSGSDIKKVDSLGNILQTYKGNITRIWSIAVNKDETLLTAGSFDKKIRIWNIGTGEITCTLEGDKKNSLAVCFSPVENILVSGSLDHSVRVWNVADCKLTNVLKRHTGNVFAVAFHPSGKYFASASGDQTIRLWDLETGKVIKTYPGHTKGILDIDFSPDGNLLLSASFDKTIRLWETKTGVCLYTFVDHQGAVNSVRFSPDGKHFASGSADETVMYWKLGKKIFVDYYYNSEITDDINNSDLLEPRGKGESRQDYKIREEKGNKYLDELYNKYYEKYLNKLKNEKFKIQDPK